MDGPKDSYLLFFTAGFHFLLPLEWVERVTGMTGRDPELPLADFAGLAHPSCGTDCAGLEDDPGRDYLIIAGTDAGKFGISAEHVTGLVRIEEARIYGLPDAVRCDGNRCLGGMAFVDVAEEERGPAFVLHPQFLALQPV